MQNSVFNKINESSRLIVLTLLILIILVAKSIYLLIFLFMFTLLMLILTDKSVKEYIEFIKKIKYLLLFIFIMYIIVFRNIIGCFYLIYKIILIVLLIKQFLFTTSLVELINAIRTLLNPLKKIVNVDKISYKIIIFINFINIYLNSKIIILNKYEDTKKYIFSLKYNIFPRIFFTMFESKKIEDSLRLKFYIPKYKTYDTNSKIVIAIFSVLFIVVLFKEVIL